MEMLKRGIFLLLVVLLLGLVSAQDGSDGNSDGGILNVADLFGDITEFNPYAFYNDYGYIIDGAIFLMIFIGLGRVTLGERFKEGGKSLFIGMGLALAIALMVWEAKNDKKLLIEFGPVALIFFIAILGLAFYMLVKSMGTGGIFAVALMFVLAFFAVDFITKSSNSEYAGIQEALRGIMDSGPMKLIMPIFSILFVVALIVLIIGLVMFVFTRIFGGRRQIGP